MSRNSRYETYEINATNVDASKQVEIQLAAGTWEFKGVALKLVSGSGSTIQPSVSMTDNISAGTFSYDTLAFHAGPGGVSDWQNFPSVGTPVFLVKPGQKVYIKFNPNSGSDNNVVGWVTFNPVGTYDSNPLT